MVQYMYTIWYDSTMVPRPKSHHRIESYQINTHDGSDRTRCGWVAETQTWSQSSPSLHNITDTACATTNYFLIIAQDWTKVAWELESNALRSRKLCGIGTYLLTHLRLWVQWGRTCVWTRSQGMPATGYSSSHIPQWTSFASALRFIRKLWETRSWPLSVQTPTWRVR